MKLPEVKKILSKARKRGKFLVSELDAILEEERFFERNAAYLLKSLGEIPVRSGETDSCLEELPKTGKRKARATASTPNKDQLFDYLRDINHRPRMTREEEVRYSKRMEFSRQRLIFSIQNKAIPKEIRAMLLRFKECPGSSIDADIVPLCSKIGKCPRGKAGFIKDCCSCYNSVRSEFVERNLHLVVNITRQYRTYGIPLMDLVQEGNAALIRAVEKYDWRKGVRFQTYATFWIKQAIERCITANKGIVRVPNYLQQKMRRFRRNGILSADKSALSVKEVSDAFELSSEVAGHLLETGRGYVSLDSPQSEDDENSLADMLAMKEEESMPEGEIQKLKGRLNEALDVLSDQERFIIAHRFGLAGKDIKTLDEIGKLMSVSRERIRQLQIRALQKLKRPSLLERLAPFLS
jgi:RNA polymerase primary sigma factor